MEKSPLEVNSIYHWSAGVEQLYSSDLLSVCGWFAVEIASPSQSIPVKIANLSEVIIFINN